MESPKFAQPTANALTQACDVPHRGAHSGAVWVDRLTLAPAYRAHARPSPTLHPASVERCAQAGCEENALIAQGNEHSRVMETVITHCEPRDARPRRARLLPPPMHSNRPCSDQRECCRAR